MATVTGLTAARMLEIEAASVTDGTVVGDNLILQRHDGATIDAGDVRGPAGPQGAPGDLSQASADGRYILQDWVSFNVKDYGAVGDGVTDDTVAIQACIDAAKVYSNTKNGFTSKVDFGGRMYRVTGSLNCTGIRSPGFTMMNGGISSEAAGKIALDFAGTNEPILLDFKVWGHKTSSPRIGVYVGRAVIDGSVPACANARFVNVDVYGYFTHCAVMNFASEVSTFTACIFNNKSRSLTAYAYVLAGHAQTITDYLGAFTSDFATLPDAASGAHSNILHHESQAQYLRGPDVVLTITSISKANPAVVTVDSAALTAAGLANGNQVYLEVEGMTEVNDLNFTIANLNVGLGTFELAGVNSTSYGTFTAGKVYNRTGPAVLLNGCQGVTWDAAYLLTYGNEAIRMDLNNGGDIRGCRLNFHAEHNPSVVCRMYRDTSVKLVSDMEFKLLQSNMRHSDAIFRVQGTGTIRFDRFKFSAVQLLGTLTNGLFAPAASFGFRDADISSPVAASNLPIDTYTEFSGKVQSSDNRPILQDMDRIGFKTASVALTKPGIRWQNDSFIVYNTTQAVEKRLQQIDTATSTQLLAIGDRINTKDKFPGKMVYNITTKKALWADSGAAGGVWVDATGATAHTPS